MLDTVDGDTLRHTLPDPVAKPNTLQPEVGYADSDNEWPAPEPIASADALVQKLSDDIIPGCLRDWCVDVAERKAVPIDYVGVAAIVALSAVVGRRALIYPKRFDNWRVVPNLWGAIIGPSGVLKTPALKDSIAVLQQFEMEASADFEEQFEKYKWEQRVFEAKCKDIEKELAKPQADTVALRSELESGRPNLPSMTRYIVNDSTVEKLGEILRDNPNGVLIVRDELTGLLESLNKPGREGDRQFYLEAWNGDGSFTSDRIGRGTVRIANACVSILGGIQPGPFYSFVKDACAGGTRADGLLQRFQVLVWPDIPRNYVHVDRRPNEAAYNAAHGLFAKLISMDGTRKMYHFDKDAQEIFDTWFIALESRLRSKNETEAFSGHLGKYRSLVPSIALLWQLTVDSRSEITLEALSAAIRWAEYLESHARKVYALVESNSASAEILAQKITQEEIQDNFTIAEVEKNHWSGLSTTEAVKGAVDTLLRANWLRSRETQKSAPGRKTVRYTINPAVRTRW